MTAMKLRKAGGGVAKAANHHDPLSNNRIIKLSTTPSSLLFPPTLSSPLSLSLSLSHTLSLSFNRLLLAIMIPTRVLGIRASRPLFADSASQVTSLSLRDLPMDGMEWVDGFSAIAG